MSGEKSIAVPGVAKSLEGSRTAPPPPVECSEGRRDGQACSVLNTAIQPPDTMSLGLMGPVPSLPRRLQDRLSGCMRSSASTLPTAVAVVILAMLP